MPQSEDDPICERWNGSLGIGEGKPGGLCIREALINCLTYHPGWNWISVRLAALRAWQWAFSKLLLKTTAFGADKNLAQSRGFQRGIGQVVGQGG